MCTLPIMQAGLFATILEDVITQLRILAEFQNELRTYKAKQDTYILLLKKYNVKPAIDKTELCDINPKTLDCDHYKINKILADRTLCYQVMSDTYLELSLKSTYSPVIKYNQFVQNQSDYVVFLTEDKQRHMNVYRETAKRLRVKRNRIKSALYDIAAVTDGLMFLLRDARFKQYVKDRYIDRWQDSRTEQNLMGITTDEAGLSESISCYRRKHDEEQRIHQEVEALTYIQQNENLNRLEDVMVKYENDLEAVEVKIERMHSQYEDKLQKRLELENKLSDRDTAIRDWLQFKKEREQFKQRNLRLHEAAIIVQAWWRGVLVRLELGPYKNKRRISRTANKKQFKF